MPHLLLMLHMPCHNCPLNNITGRRAEGEGAEIWRSGYRGCVYFCLGIGSSATLIYPVTWGQITEPLHPPPLPRARGRPSVSSIEGPSLFLPAHAFPSAFLHSLPHSRGCQPVPCVRHEDKTEAWSHRGRVSRAWLPWDEDHRSLRESVRNGLPSSCVSLLHFSLHLLVSFCFAFICVLAFISSCPWSSLLGLLIPV